MYFRKLHWGALALLAVSPFVIAEQAPEASAKAGKHLACNPECEWVESSTAPNLSIAPAAMAVRQALAASAAQPAGKPAALAAPAAVPAPAVAQAAPKAVSVSAPAVTQTAPVAPAVVAPSASAKPLDKAAGSLAPPPRKPAAASKSLDLSVDHLTRQWAEQADSPAEAKPSLDLWNAVSLAVDTYPSIRDAAAVLDQQREAVNVAKAGYLPTIQTGINTGKQGVYGSGQNLSLTASQTLYDFGKVRNQVKGAESGVRTQQFQVMAEVDQVARQSALAAIEVERFRSLRDVAKAQLEGVKRLQDLARQRAAEGASTQADLVQAQSRVESAQASLLAIETQLRQQQSKLRTMIGQELPEGGVSVPEERLRQAAAMIEPNPEQPVAVRLAESQLQEAEAQRALAKSNTLPTFVAEGGVNKYLGNAGDMAGDRVYTLTVGIKHDLYSGGAPSARVRGAEQAVLAAEERIQTKKLESRDEWIGLQEQMGGLGDRLRVLAERKKSIVETQKLYREQYLSLGTRTLLDLLNAEQEIFQAQSDSVNAQHDLWAAQVAFISTTGHMHDVFQLKGDFL
ncbi:TolC family protein [Pseudomonas panipatensis]|uniref:Outer membrane protein, adhesin transport system n=1 Tax=Pseudomonas panipatensis TaxID=428992 RepID=A0A1G8FJK6_9PSED|nr:TolC family protein [Pseudomonas panipatensis]SDH82317.1 outer membrane protein, adhesin transport system [Pseudomonas panipatensis]SMP53264.1 outer membrane protein, adhesin transport system [Pseudomonas panipatensis]